MACVELNHSLHCAPACLPAFLPAGALPMYRESSYIAGSPPMSIDPYMSLSASFPFCGFDYERPPLPDCSPAAHCSCDAALFSRLPSPSPPTARGGSSATLTRVSADSSTLSAECDAVEFSQCPQPAAAAAREAAALRRAREKSLLGRLESLSRGRATAASPQQLLPRPLRPTALQDELGVRRGKEAVLADAAALLEEDAETIRQLKAEVRRLTDQQCSSSSSSSARSHLMPRCHCAVPPTASLPSAERLNEPTDSERFQDERRALASSVLVLGHLTMLLVDMSTGCLLDANQSAAPQCH